MNRYFFNFRAGREVTRDRLGMYLPDLEAARAEAIHASRDLSFLARQAGEGLCDYEIEVADASGEPVLKVPLAS